MTDETNTSAQSAICVETDIMHVNGGRHPTGAALVVAVNADGTPIGSSSSSDAAPAIERTMMVGMIFTADKPGFQPDSVQGLGEGDYISSLIITTINAQPTDATQFISLAIQSANDDAPGTIGIPVGSNGAACLSHLKIPYVSTGTSFDVSNLKSGSIYITAVFNVVKK